MMSWLLGAGTIGDWLMELVLVAAAISGNLAAECPVPNGKEIASVVTAEGQRATIAPGALSVGDKTWTRCEGLPGAHPIALSPWRRGVAISFREAGLFYWNDADGFSPIRVPKSSPVRALAGDETNLWVGTVAGGLWRVDASGVFPAGERQLRGKRVTALHIARGGELHIGTDPRGWWIKPRGGAMRRHRRSTLVGCFRQIANKVVPSPPGPDCLPGALPLSSFAHGPGLPSTHVTSLVTHKSDLFIGLFDAGVWKQARGGDAARGFVSLGGPKFINQLVSCRSKVYAATAKGLFVARDAGDSFAGLDRVDLGLKSSHVNGLACGSRGRLLLATGAGVVVWDGAYVKQIGQDDGLPSPIVYSVAETGDGAIWAGTRSGVARISSGRVQLYNQANGKTPHDWINALLPIGDNVLAGTYDAGAVLLSAEATSAPVAGFDTAWINPNGLFTVGGYTLAATLGDGLLVSSGGIRHKIAPLPSSDVTAVTVHQERLWVGTRGGLAILSLQAK